MANVNDDSVIANTNTVLYTEEELAAKAKILQKSWFGSVIPILKCEAKRFIVMSAAFFLIAFLYTFLRLYKDNVIHSVLEPSAQNWLKLFTFGASLITVGAIGKLLVYYSIDMVFEIGTIFFGALLFAMAFLIKYRRLVQFKDGWAQELFIDNTADCRGVSVLYVLMLIVNHWVLSLFYIACEVIGSVMVSYLFLTYVNSHCTNDQNKRFVRILYIFSNVSGFSASLIYKYWNGLMMKSVLEVKEAYYVYFTFGAVAIFGLILGMKRILDVLFLTPLVVDSGKAKKPLKSKKSVSMTDGLYYAFISKLLLAMCGMTLFYNISANLLTSIFTNSISTAAIVLGEDKTTFGNVYKSKEMMWTAGLVIVVMLSPVSKLFERFGVASSGSIPILISFSGIIADTIMAAINFPALGQDNLSIVKYFNDFKRNPLLEVKINLIVASAVKISKYAFFDIIKEAISMKINPEIRPLFKGVYDGVCGKLGKCAGAIYGLVMEATTGSRDCRYYAPITCIIIMIFSVMWAWAVYYLHVNYKKANEKGTYLSPDYFEGFNLKDE